jgi:hypothetical protein
MIQDKVRSKLDSPTKINCDYKSIVDNNIGAKDSMTAIRRGPASKEKLANDYIPCVLQYLKRYEYD